jgi:hypothetical protein
LILSMSATLMITRPHEMNHQAISPMILGMAE